MKKTRKFFVALFALAVTLAMCFCFVACDDEPAEEKMHFEKASDSADGYATLYMPSDGQLDVMVLSDPQVDIWEKYQTVGSPATTRPTSSSRTSSRQPTPISWSSTATS